MPKLRRRRKRTGSKPKPKPKPVKRQKIAPLKKAARLRMKLRRQAKPRMLFKKVSYFIVYSLIGPSVLMMAGSYFFFWFAMVRSHFLNFIFHFLMLFKKVSYFIVYSLIGPSVLMMTVTFSFDLRWLDLTFLNFIFHFFSRGKFIRKWEGENDWWRTTFYSFTSID